MTNFKEAPKDQKTNLGGSTTQVTVKTLFDHGSHNRNKLVIYDDDPRIEAVMAQAHVRHEAKIHEQGA